MVAAAHGDGFDGGQLHVPMSVIQAVGPQPKLFFLKNANYRRVSVRGTGPCGVLPLIEAPAVSKRAGGVTLAA